MRHLRIREMIRVIECQIGGSRFCLTSLQAKMQPPLTEQLHKTRPTFGKHWVAYMTHSKVLEEDVKGIGTQRSYCCSLYLATSPKLSVSDPNYLKPKRAFEPVEVSKGVELDFHTQLLACAVTYVQYDLKF